MSPEEYFAQHPEEEEEFYDEIERLHSNDEPIKEDAWAF